MANQLISISDAAALANKSAQTIRRLIKNDKVKSRRKRTPQGFNYMIDKASLLEYFNNDIPQPEPEEEKLEPVPEETQEVEESEPEIYVLDPEDEDVREEVNKVEEEVVETLEEAGQSPDSNLQTPDDSANYAVIVEKLIDQHQSDKDRLYALVEAFQNRVVTLEEQIKLLQAPKKKWWKVWK